MSLLSGVQNNRNNNNVDEEEEEEVTQETIQVLGEVVDTIMKTAENISNDNNSSSGATNCGKKPSEQIILSKVEEEKEALNHIGEMNLQAMEEMDKEEDKDNEGFVIGDHVYTWCSLIGIPGMFQHHGIVIDVNDDDDQVTIADFSGMVSDSSRRTDSNKSSVTEPEQESNEVVMNHDEIQEEIPQQEEQVAPGKNKLLFPIPNSSPSIRQYTIEESSEKTKWKKVQYKAGWMQRTFQRSGTCTIVESDPPGLVLSRVRFLMERSDVVPPYHWLQANCECVAVWCKTGTWATLQASSFLEVTTAGQMKSTATLAMYASTQTVSVPAAGVWGSWFGMTTKVSLLAAQPHLIPMLAGYGLLTIGGPVWVLHRCKYAWNKHTSTLNDEFWSHAIEHPDVFVDCITHWSNV